MEDNKPYHVPYQHKTGTRLRVARMVTEAHAWHGEWPDAGNALVGKVVTVTGHDEIRGYWCSGRGLTSAWLPSCALEPPYQQGETCVIEVPSVQ